MSIFDDIDRPCQEPANPQIGHFDYLNMSGRAAAGHVRNLIDSWLTHYPISDRDQMVSRLSSRHNDLHLSAFFELFLHEFLLKQQFKIEKIEPTLSNGRAPDFLAMSPDGTRFYLEATLASGLSDQDAGAERRMRDAIQAIDSVESPDFFVHLETEGTPSQPIALKKLRLAVQRFLDSLDYESEQQRVSTTEPLRPIWKHEEHGAIFTISPIPKNTRSVGRGAIGSQMLGPTWVQGDLAIKSSVVRKAQHYGEIDLPLLIAVNALQDFVEAEDAVNAVFGSLGNPVVRDGETKFARNTDGAWLGPTGPTNTRASALLFTNRLRPWSVGQCSAQLIHNPWARTPIPKIPLSVDSLCVVGEQLVLTQGRSLQEILKLPAGWPEHHAA